MDPAGARWSTRFGRAAPTSRRGFLLRAAGLPATLVGTAGSSRPRSVLEFGAVGDGEHDDTAAFAAALARPGLTLVPNPPANYRITRPLAIRAEVGADPYLSEGSPSLLGESRVRTVIRYEGHDGACLDIAGAAPDLTSRGKLTGVVVANLRLEGGGLQDPSVGVRATAFTHLQLRNLYIRNFGIGIALDRQYYDQAPHHGIDDWSYMATLENLSVLRCSTGLWGGGVFEVDHILSLNSEFTECVVGADVWAQNWVDNAGMYAGYQTGVRLRDGDRPNFPNKNMVFAGTRFEQGAGRANLLIEQGGSLSLLSCYWSVSGLAGLEMAPRTGRSAKVQLFGGTFDGRESNAAILGPAQGGAAEVYLYNTVFNNFSRPLQPRLARIYRAMFETVP